MKKDADLAHDCDIEDLEKALRDGPYGRCVYQCDNDVVDHQIVNMEFEGGRTAAFTMVAFSGTLSVCPKLSYLLSEKICERRTVVSGTKGELTCDDGDEVRHYDFATRRGKDLSSSTQHIQWGHGGSDYYLIEAFVNAVVRNFYLFPHLSYVALIYGRLRGILRW